MNRETEPIPNPQQVANMTQVLAQMERSGSIHFVKALPQSAIQHPRAKLHLPKQFVEENGDKFNLSVTLRVQTSTGRSSRSWRVRVSAFATSHVTIVRGWPAFVKDNRLKKGDYAVFALREDARSEFVVHFFRGPQASSYFPNEEDDEENESSDSEKEENNNNESRLASPVHQQDEHNQPDEHNQAPNQAFSRDIGEANPAPLQHTGNPPRFSKRLAASNIARSAGERNSGQFEFPARFMRTHGDRVHDSVKLQGIHENSRNYVITCHRRPRNLHKVYFTPTEWSRFVQDNGLKEGDKLQFSLMADSYFLVRKISA